MEHQYSGAMGEKREQMSLCKTKAFPKRKSEGTGEASEKHPKKYD